MFHKKLDILYPASRGLVNSLDVKREYERPLLAQSKFNTVTNVLIKNISSINFVHRVSKFSFITQSG